MKDLDNNGGVVVVSCWHFANFGETPIVCLLIGSA
jgi:hypothetical protein